VAGEYPGVRGVATPPNALRATAAPHTRTSAPSESLHNTRELSEEPMFRGEGVRSGWGGR
jgi:hypothetical protein